VSSAKGSLVKITDIKGNLYSSFESTGTDRIDLSASPSGNYIVTSELGGRIEKRTITLVK
jgi:hypothetical protein